METREATLLYRPPYPFDKMLRFLAGRAIPGVEKVAGGSYIRVARLRGRDGGWHAGWLEVSRLPGQDALRVRLSEGLEPVLSQALSRVRRLFDLYCDPERVGAVLKRMDDYRPGLWMEGIRLPGCFEPFETAARAILGQQVTVKTASAIAGRVAEAFGSRVETGREGLTRAFPEAEDILALGEGAQDRMGALGVTGARSRCMYTLAGALAGGDITLDERADPEEEISRLLAIKGIGNWTAQYIAMRVLHWPDAFLETDAGVRQALPGLEPREMLALAEAWRPFRSYAVMCLWNSL